MSDAKQIVLFHNVCDLLHAGHNMGSGTSVGTLNRLFIKNLDGGNSYNVVNPPWLSEENVTVTIESWKKEDLWKLAPRKESREPRYPHFPVVIVRYKGENRLIDGGSRANAWRAARDTGEHSAYVLTVHE